MEANGSKRDDYVMISKHEVTSESGSYLVSIYCANLLSAP